MGEFGQSDSASSDTNLSPSVVMFANAEVMHSSSSISLPDGKLKLEITLRITATNTGPVHLSRSRKTTGTLISTVTSLLNQCNQSTHFQLNQPAVFGSSQQIETCHMTVPAIEAIPLLSSSDAH